MSFLKRIFRPCNLFKSKTCYSFSNYGNSFCSAPKNDDIHSIKHPKFQTDRKKLEEMLANAAEEQPGDTADPDDDWRTSPYPVGSVVNWKQSQAQKSLRPNVDPRSTSIILFPGQGSQYVGMGKELLKFPMAKDIFEAANEILKYDLLKLMLHGPPAKLNKTIYSQPAVFVCSLAAIEKLKEESPTAIENCMATAGFGVGELAALTFAGVFTFDTGLKLVNLRAEAMQLASEITPSGMATVYIGHQSKLHYACVKAKEWCVERGIENPECIIASYISPEIKVVAGNLEALKYLEVNQSLYKLEKVERIPDINGAFHSFLMAPAAQMFRDTFKKVKLMEPVICVHSNVDGKMYKNADQVFRQLPKQMYKPVRWEQTLHILYERTKGAYYPYTYICGPTGTLKQYLEGVNKVASQQCYSISV